MRMSRSWQGSLALLGAAIALAGPGGLSCGAAAPAYYPGAAATVPTEIAASADDGAAWDMPGTGWSAPPDAVLAQDETGATATDATPPPTRTSGEQGGEAAGSAVPEGELAWDEIALPEVARPAERLVVKNGVVVRPT